MRPTVVFIAFVAFVIGGVLELQADAASAGMLIRQLTSLVKWSRPSSKATNQLDGNVLHFEDGYLVETVVEGNDLGVVPYSIRVSRDGELFAVDAVNSNIVRITPPLSRYSRARLVAGSFQGHTGHVDGKPSDARFNRPKGVTVDDKGNVYVADTSNLAIRKIGDGGVTTIAGGKSNVAGYRDGPSEDAKFSSDFDIVYVRSTCSLLVIDRGNVALRKISLNQEDCDYENHSIVPTDLFLVAGAILIGYISCKLQQGFGSFFSPRMEEHDGAKMEEEMASKVIPDSSDDSLKEEQESSWHSFGQVLWDAIKLAPETITGVVSQFVPSRFKAKEGLTPLKDSLVMPEDESPALKQRSAAPIPGSTPTDRYPEVKALKMRSTSSKDRAASSSKHRSSRRQEYSEFYGSDETPPPPPSQYGQVRTRIQKERSRHRDKNGEGSFGALESKAVENKGSSGYDKPKYEPYNFRSKYGGGDSYHFE